MRRSLRSGLVRRRIEPDCSGQQYTGLSTSAFAPGARRGLGRFHLPSIPSIKEGKTGQLGDERFYFFKGAVDDWFGVDFEPVFEDVGVETSKVVVELEVTFDPVDRID